jgi:hypothetical protein
MSNKTHMLLLTSQGSRSARIIIIGFNIYMSTIPEGIANRCRRHRLITTPAGDDISEVCKSPEFVG